MRKVSIFVIALVCLVAASKHPGYKIESVKPDNMDWSIGGMDFLSDGRLVVSAWKYPFGVYIISNVIGGGKPTMKEYASGLGEMLGVKVVNDSIYVVQKDEITLLLDHDNDGRADDFQTITSDWSRTTNQKNYAFGLPFDGKNFYVAFNADLIGSAEIRNPQPPGRDNAVYQISRATGEIIPFSGGHRVPSGIGWAYNELWVTENQGGYRPNNPLFNVRKDRWYGRLVEGKNIPFLQTFPWPGEEGIVPDNEYSPPAMDMFHNDLAQSPSTPIAIYEGIFKGQLFVADAFKNEKKEVRFNPTGGLRRVYIEKVPDGKGGTEYQGAGFEFMSEGFANKGVWDMVWGRDGNLYTGHNGGKGWNPSKRGNTQTGLERMVPTGVKVFEMLAIRNTGDRTFEIDFTEKVNAGVDFKSSLEIQGSRAELHRRYGSKNEYDANQTVQSATLINNGMTIKVTTSKQLTKRRTYTFKWSSSVKSEGGKSMLNREAWYTLNHYGPGSPPCVTEAECKAFKLVSNKKVIAKSNPFSMNITRNNGNGWNVNLNLSSKKYFSSTLTDVSGRIIDSFEGTGSTAWKISNSELNQGIYFLHVRSQGNSITKKLLKK